MTRGATLPNWSVILRFDDLAANRTFAVSGGGIVLDSERQSGSVAAVHTFRSWALVGYDEGPRTFGVEQYAAGGPTAVCDRVSEPSRGGVCGLAPTVGW